MYNKRMNMNPDWLTTVVGGINRKTGEPFLGMVDLHGLKVENDYCITGLGAHYCKVLFENQWRADMSEEEAVALMVQAHKVMHYRDKKGSDIVQICKINGNGVTLDEPFRIEGEWNLEWW